MDQSLIRRSVGKYVRSTGLFHPTVVPVRNRRRLHSQKGLSWKRLPYRSADREADANALDETTIRLFKTGLLILGRHVIEQADDPLHRGILDAVERAQRPGPRETCAPTVPPATRNSRHPPPTMSQTKWSSQPDSGVLVSRMCDGRRNKVICHVCRRQNHVRKV